MKLFVPNSYEPEKIEGDQSEFEKRWKAVGFSPAKVLVFWMESDWELDESGFFHKCFVTVNYEHGKVSTLALSNSDLEIKQEQFGHVAKITTQYWKLNMARGKKGEAKLERKKRVAVANVIDYAMRYLPYRNEQLREQGREIKCFFVPNRTDLSKLEKQNDPGRIL